MEDFVDTKPISRQSSFLYATHYEIPSKLPSLDETENITDKLPPDIASPAFLEEGVKQRVVVHILEPHEDLKQDIQNEITQEKKLERKSSVQEMVEVIKRQSRHCCSLDPFCGFWCCNSSEPHIINVRVKDIHQLFNTLDPSPFYDKDISDELEDYIFAYAEDAEEIDKLQLHIRIQNSAELYKSGYHYREEDLRASILNNFQRRAEDMNRKIRSVFKDGKTAMLLGLLVLALCLTGSRLSCLQKKHLIFLINKKAELEDKNWASFLSEMLVIAGWVVMWKPIEMLVYQWWPLLRRRRLYSRLSKMKVIISRGDTFV